MKNFERIYKGIKTIEEETLFKFDRQEGYDEFIFLYETDFYDQYLHIGKDDFYVVVPKGCNTVLFNKNELKAFTDFMEILKEAEE